MNHDIRGTVQCPSSYFKKMAMVDYTNWRQALAREFYQNSIDAGSKNIYVDFDYPNSIVTIKDDGCGMTLDIILDKLLVLGGTHKASGSVGAFGKAKELLYFSWPSWSVETKGLFITGKGPDYVINKTDSKIKGTISTVHIDEDSIYKVKDSFCYIATKMDTRSKIFVDGTRYRQEYSKGILIESFNFGHLYMNRAKPSSYMSYKINGIWMFDTYIGSSTKGTFTFELTRSSIELLTSNRDDMQWEYRNKVQELVNRMATEKESMAKKKYDLIKEYFSGPLCPIPILSPSTALEPVPDVSYTHVFDGNKNIPLGTNRSVGFDKPLGVTLKGYDKDFAIIYCKKHRSKVKYFMRQKRAGLLLKIWENIIDQVLTDNNIDTDFIPGFTFDANTEASIIPGNRPEIFINPNLIDDSKRIISNRLFLTEKLKDKAIHEITHMDYESHDETFVAKMHKTRSNTLKSYKKYNKIGRMKG